RETGRHEWMIAAHEECLQEPGSHLRRTDQGRGRNSFPGACASRFEYTWQMRRHSGRNNPTRSEGETEQPHCTIHRHVRIVCTMGLAAARSLARQNDEVER